MDGGLITSPPLHYLLRGGKTKFLNEKTIVYLICKNLGNTERQIFLRFQMTKQIVLHNRRKLY